MPQDLRDRNQYFQSKEVGQYIREYAGAISYGLNRVDSNSLESALNLMKTAPRIFVGGNGGSAAIADHLVCDFSKGAATNVHSLVGDLALFTALANDEGYEKTFSRQLELKGLGKGDAVFLISSSGNSKNIIEAASYAKSMNAYVCGLTGFDGGALFRMADIVLHVPFNNYGIVEDCHQAIMHVLAQTYYLSNK